MNERLISLRIPLSCGNHFTIISVYASTLPSTNEVKESFYSQLQEATSRVLQTDKLHIIGDFNALVGRDFRVWDGILGHHGIGI